MLSDSLRQLLHPTGTEATQTVVPDLLVPSQNGNSIEIMLWPCGIDCRGSMTFRRCRPTDSH